jgi:hypothetical protein
MTGFLGSCPRSIDHFPLMHRFLQQQKKPTGRVFGRLVIGSLFWSNAKKSFPIQEAWLVLVDASENQPPVIDSPALPC